MNKKHIKMFRFSSLILCSLVFFGCSHNLDHPLNSTSESYIGDVLAADNNGNGISDLLDIYPNCGTNFECAINKAIEDSLLTYRTPLSSNIPDDATSSSSNLAVSSSSKIEIIPPEPTVWPEVLEFDVVYRDFSATHADFQPYSLGELCGESEINIPGETNPQMYGEFNNGAYRGFVHENTANADWSEATTITKGMVKTRLIALDINEPLYDFPIKDSALCNNGYFSQWFVGEDIKYSKIEKLVLTKGGYNTLSIAETEVENEYSFYSGDISNNKGFFPVEDFGYGNQNYQMFCDGKSASAICNEQLMGEANPLNGTLHNYNHTMAMHAYFSYTSSNAFFEIAGDDDIWVFIDGLLVIDFGGVHNPALGKINISDIAGAEWEENSVHSINIYKAQRQIDESYFRIKTNLRLFTQ